ncbi:glycosyltransferase family 2 protein [Paenibacillus sonchi]|uniref:glycosyltransferase family 2 protein n=1 Tax=Paenibacillus sonchi TaxID=373687 RepID=UPI001F3B46A2|nr:glycosyltransferase family 2 protein [Paenibacillus sonchi]
MIVKDEEALLSRCLESVKGIADEIIIVDTGSTDRTKQIAENYGAKIYDYVWSNDFAAARNESLRHAAGKWILVLDADEYLGSNDHSKWIEFLQKEKPQAHLAYTLPVINFTGKKIIRRK